MVWTIGLLPRVLLTLAALRDEDLAVLMTEALVRVCEFNLVLLRLRDVATLIGDLGVETVPRLLEEAALVGALTAEEV